MSDQSFPPQPNPQYNQQPPPQQPYQQPYQQQPYQQQPYQQAPPPQSPYGQQQPPAPYPQQQAYPQTPPPPDPYGQQQAYQQQPGAYQQQPAAPQGPPPGVPAPADWVRRYGASAIDGLLFAGVAALVALTARNNVRQVLPLIPCAAFGLSFVNHVLLTRIAGASIGKLFTRTRVIRVTDGSTPHLPRLFRRWLVGFLHLAISWIVEWWRNMYRGNRAVYRHPELSADSCGIRLVRYVDLQAAGSPQTR
ncbi:RDD family protein [Streptomyces sp. NPDC059152]|uniref:RDD family protein n=1 Tax=Streptomyces sp. NPDC059152 TaxID=3346742 RepID=UPI003685BFF0